MCKKLPHLKSPCSSCPFRKDSIFGWLGAERVVGILNQDSFVCHKTTHTELHDRKQCAGHMLLANDVNKYVRLADVTGIDLELTGIDLLFDTQEDCIKHHGGL